MRVVGPGDAPTLAAPRAPGLRARVLTGAGGGEGAGLAEIEVAPGQTLPARAHPNGDALVYVIGGRGRILGEDGAQEIVGGAVAHLPGGARVAITSAGVEPLRLLAVYSPPGPERGFLDWGETDENAIRDPQALLDLTGLPRRQRHRTVIAALEALDPRSRLLVVNDHEPTGLQRQLERRYETRLGWDVQDRRPDRVAVAIWLEEDPGALVVLSGAERAGGDLSPSAA